jgi:hypothetical protein
MTGRTGFITAGLALALVSGCTAHRPARPASPPQPQGKAALVAFDSCADLLAGMRSALATSLATAPRKEAAVGGPAIGPQAGAAADAEHAAPIAGTDYSTTNTAESTVDEPDLVKTDGRRIVTVAGGVLRVVDAASRQVTGTLALPGAGGRVRYGLAGNLLLSGDRALVTLGPTAVPVDDIGDTGIVPTVALRQRLLLVDLSAAQPSIAGSYDIDGQVVDARQVGPVVRVVVTSAPRVGTPEEAGRAGLDDLLPRYSVSTKDGTVHRRVDCTSVTRPAIYSGTSMLTILTLDLSRPSLGTGDPVTIAADATTVYANGPSLYLAGPAGDWSATQLYAFDSSGTGRPRYLASGRVPGHLLSQYALSEWRGDLRLVTTAADTSTVYVLRRQGTVLREVGSAGGLGKGQRVYGVRFAGPVGYVVTFRQTDPLYTVDLSDPARPRVTGALELTGYSAYLHPLGDGQLIGVGQEADRDGRARGAQVSLFDVSDPARPRRVAHYVLPGTWSSSQYDPHAFLYWAPTGLLAVPVTGRGGGTTLALRVRGGTITPLSWPSSPAVEPLRTLVVNRTVWTIATNGLTATTLDTLTPEAWLPF